MTSLRERTRLEETAGVKLDCGFGPSCTMLTDDRRCSVYEIRPLICRLWGITRSMPCPYGCKPDRVVEDDEAMLMLHEADRIGGVQTRRAETLMRQIEAQRRVVDEATMRANARDIIRRVTQRASLDGRHELAKSIFEQR